MKSIVEFLTSASFGFLLKLLSGLATAAFGILGIGTKTREENGKLTRNGRIALVGILIAAFLAVGTNVYEFAVNRKKEIQQDNIALQGRADTEQIKLDLSRLRYPFKGITLGFSLSIQPIPDSLQPYYRQVTKEIELDSNCKTTTFKCFATETIPDGFPDRIYQVDSTSSAFPQADSVARAFIESLGVKVCPIKQLPATQDQMATYQTLGCFRVLLHDLKTSDWFLVVNPDEGQIVVRANDIPVPDKLPLGANANSLADFAPGALALRPTSAANFLFHEMGKHDYTIPQFVVTFNKFTESVRVGALKMRFEYPKSIVGSKPFAAECTDTHFVASRLPENIEKPNSFGEIGDIGFTEADSKRLCAQLYKDDNGDE